MKLTKTQKIKLKKIQSLLKKANDLFEEISKENKSFSNDANHSILSNRFFYIIQLVSYLNED